MFAGRLEAWKSGPVGSNVHAVFAGSSAVIGADELGESIALPVEDAELLRAVWGRYGRYSAHGLRVLTHDEPPWKDARARAEDACGGEITHEAMAGYFRSVAEKETPGGLLEMIPPARVYQSMADEARGDVFTHAEVFARARRRAGHAV